MPTIDELTPAAAAADGDLIAVSQGGVTRRVTRTQILAGTQQALAVRQGGLLGRSSSGVGEPEVVSVGSNLRLQDGVLSGPDSFSVTSLPVTNVVQPSDVIALGQNGRDASVPVGTLMAALPTVPGLDMSGQVVRLPNQVGRSLSDWAGDWATVEAFGAIGDGVADDTAAIARAVASGRPVRFGPRRYILNGQFTLSDAVTLLGVPGKTVLCRLRQSGGAWISIKAAPFSARGIIFDAGSIAGESWGVLVESTCTESRFEECWFRGATGSTLGSGLVVQARDGSSGGTSKHAVRCCEASGNAVHGIWIQAAAGAVVESCSAHDNGQYGICIDFNDPTFQQKARHCAVLSSRAFGNRRGISVGNYNETNLEPPRWGTGNPDVVGALVSGNRCYDNTDYGIAVSGQAMLVSGNVVEANGSGILVNAVETTIVDNTVMGPGQFGIDAGGSADCELRGNSVSGFNVGINPGGSSNVRVVRNRLSRNVWGITAYAVETDGHGTPFGISCSGLTIEANRIALNDGTGGGILLADGPQSVAVLNNSFWAGAGSQPVQALWAHTDQYVVRGNLWNNLSRMICNPVTVGSLQQVQVPDALDEAMLTSAPTGVGSIVGQHQADMAGQVSFVRVTSGGRGYTQASVTISGTGTGASGLALLRDGAVLGVMLTSGGSGYAGGAVTVSFAGNGTGAQAVATVGLPVPEERRLRLHCNGPVRFKRVGSAPFQDNWTGTDILVPQASSIEWVGTWGGWQATSFPLADYLAPAGDGSLVVRSAAGDIVARPAGGGRFRVSTDAEPVGYMSLLGRGSPEGVVAASAGSDYRNLDGGSGSTLWVKRSGTGSAGWTAVG